MKNTRRDFFKQSASLAALSAVGLGATGCTPRERNEVDRGVEWPATEGPDTPKMCYWLTRNSGEESMRALKQIGIDHIVTGGPPTPWEEDELRAIMDRFAANGLRILVMMIGGIGETIRGGPGRDEEIENFKQSLRAAGAVGLPVVEYNWYTHRLREAYYEVEGRAGAGYMGLDYERARDLPPREGQGRHTAEELWDRLTHFLREVIPVAEGAGVRMALHPNDPPVPVSRGSDQIIATLDDWKRLVNIVDSPANGMTCHSGLTTEIGENVVEFLRYMGERDRINHVHMRNVVVEEPRVKYVEVFPDEGDADMFGFMRELVRQGYNLGFFPEHPRAIDYDREYGGLTGPGGYGDVGGGGFAGTCYDVGYARAMLQAALIAEGKV